MKKFKDLGIISSAQTFEGKRIEIEDILNIEIIVKKYKIVPSKYPEKGNGKRLDLQINHDDKDRVLWTGSIILQDMIERVNEDDFPFTTKIIKENKGYKFT